MPGQELPRGLFSLNVLTELEDRDYFISCIDQFIRWYGAEWGCLVDTSERRLGDAFDFWQDDASRTKAFGMPRKAKLAVEIAPPIPEEVKLNHFKHASMIAFWLRRMNVINSTDVMLPSGTASITIQDYEPTEEQWHFLRFGNELSALMIGYYLSLNYEIQAFEKRMKEIWGPTSAFKSGERKRLLTSVKPSDSLIMEFPGLMRSKNISWHGLYMVYRTMFEPLQVPRRRR